MFGDGEQTRDFVHVDDVVRALLTAAERDGGVFNVGTGVETTVNRLHELCREASGIDAPPRHAPGTARRRATQRARRVAAARELGWRSKVGLADGLRVHLGSMQREGVRRRRAKSCSPWTSPSHPRRNRLPSRGAPPRSSRSSSPPSSSSCCSWSPAARCSQGPTGRRRPPRRSRPRRRRRSMRLRRRRRRPRRGPPAPQGLGRRAQRQRPPGRRRGRLEPHRGPRLPDQHSSATRPATTTRARSSCTGPGSRRRASASARDLGIRPRVAARRHATQPAARRAHGRHPRRVTAPHAHCRSQAPVVDRLAGDVERPAGYPLAAVRVERVRGC